MGKLNRRDSDELNRAMSEVESAESNGRVGTHAYRYTGQTWARGLVRGRSHSKSI